MAIASCKSASMPVVAKRRRTSIIAFEMIRLDRNSAKPLTSSYIAKSAMSEIWQLQRSMSTPFLQDPASRPGNFKADGYPVVVQFETVPLPSMAAKRESPCVGLSTKMLTSRRAFGARGSCLHSFVGGKPFFTMVRSPPGPIGTFLRP